MKFTYLDFDLVVNTPQMFKGPICLPAAQISGVKHERAVSVLLEHDKKQFKLRIPVVGKNIGFVSLFGLFWQVEVALSYTGASGPHETGLANWYGAHVLVQYVDIVVRGRRAYVDLATTDVVAPRIDNGDLSGNIHP